MGLDGSSSTDIAGGREIWGYPMKYGIAKLETVGDTLTGVLTYAALAWLRPDRQFWHDVVCGTRLVDHKPALPAKSKSKA